MVRYDIDRFNKVITRKGEIENIYLNTSKNDVIKLPARVPIFKLETTAKYESRYY